MEGSLLARGLIGAELPAYATATAVLDPIHIWDLHHRSGRCQILNPLSEARDPTRNLMDPCQIRLRCTTTGTPDVIHF